MGKFGSDIGALLHSLGDGAKAATEKLESFSKEKVGDLEEFAFIKIQSMIKRIDFDQLTEKIDNYQRNSGKDVSLLLDFVNELKKLAYGNDENHTSQED